MKKLLVVMLFFCCLATTVHAANDFFNASGNPAEDSFATSATLRTEYESIEDGFDKFPAFSGNTVKYLRINAGETAVEAVSAATIAAAHTIAEHSDTTATGPELDDLTDGSAADALHTHGTTYQPLEATLTDIADGTIAENLVNTANPWADNEIADAHSHAADSIDNITEIAAALKDGSGDCSSGLLCLGDHTHATTYQPLESTLTDIADGTIVENLVNTANPWADNEVADNITASSYMPLGGGTYSGETYTGGNMIEYANGSGGFLDLNAANINFGFNGGDQITISNNNMFFNMNSISGSEGFVLQEAGVAKGYVTATSSGELNVLGGSTFITTSYNFVPFADASYNLGETAPGREWLNLYVVNSPVVSSDINMKKDIQVLTISDVSWLYDLQPISYKWKKEKRGKEVHFGFSAQEIYEKNPKKDSFVTKKALKIGGNPANETDYEFSMSPSEIIGPLLVLVKEQKAKIEALGARVTALETP